MDYNKIGRFFFPVHCPICDRAQPGEQKICPECAGIPRIVQPPRCLKCSKHIKIKSRTVADCCLCCSIRVVYIYNVVMNFKLAKCRAVLGIPITWNLCRCVEVTNSIVQFSGRYSKVN